MQFDGDHLRFKVRLAVDLLIDLFLALARGNGLGDRQVTLRHLLVDRRGFFLRVVHGCLYVFLLVLIQLESFGHAVEPRTGSEAAAGHAHATTAATSTTAAALGKYQRGGQKSG